MIGGAVAGPAAVRALAMAGLRVVWIFPATVSAGDIVGETLAPAANPVLDRLGFANVLQSTAHRASHTVLSSWGSGQLLDRNSIMHLEGAGLVLDRKRFEAELRAAATETAAEIIDAKLKDVEVHGGQWQLHLSDGREVCADAVIDASGRVAALGRLYSSLNRGDQLTAACAFLEQISDEVEPTKAVLIEAVASGWWYGALLPDGRLSVGFYTDPDLLTAPLNRNLEAWRSYISETDYIGRWIEDAGFQVKQPPRMWSAGTTWLSEAAGVVDGAPWMAIGDAAAAFDPLSSHGMTTALWAGEQAGQVLPAALQGDHRSLDTYVKSVSDGVAQFLNQRAAMYGTEARFQHAFFWQRRLSGHSMAQG